MVCYGRVALEPDTGEASQQSVIAMDLLSRAMLPSLSGPEA
jgi:hypothetical protein